MWASVDSLSDEDYHHELDYSIGAIHRHHVHTLLAERLWLDVACGISPRDLQDNNGPDNYDRTNVTAGWEVLEKEIFDYLVTVDDSTLQGNVTYDFPWCGKQSHPRWYCLMYILEHGVDHRAQMLAGLHRLGAKTMMQDFITFVWEQNAESTQFHIS